MESVPYDKRSGKIWFNGKTVDWADANIHILNHGLHYASCVFEGERVYDGEIFKLEEHTERLFYSAKRMGINVPYSQQEINDASKNIVNIQKVQNGYVRPHISILNFLNVYNIFTRIIYFLLRIRNIDSHSFSRIKKSFCMLF